MPRSEAMTFVSSIDFLLLWRIVLLFSRAVMSSSLQPHGQQHTRLPSPSVSTGVCSDWWPLSQVMPSNNLILCLQLQNESYQLIFRRIICDHRNWWGKSQGQPAYLVYWGVSTQEVHTLNNCSYGAFNWLCQIFFYPLGISVIFSNFWAIGLLKCSLGTSLVVH